MMGRQATGREQLFYTFSMEDHVPQEHLLRGIHHFLDLSSFRQHLEPFYSPVGRPSIDPELMIRMLKSVTALVAFNYVACFACQDRALTASKLRLRNKATHRPLQPVALAQMDDRCRTS